MGHHLVPGLMKAFPGEKTFTPPSVLGLQPPFSSRRPAPAMPRPEPAPLPVEQPCLGKGTGGTQRNMRKTYMVEWFSIEKGSTNGGFFRGFSMFFQHLNLQEGEPFFFMADLMRIYAI